MTPQDAASPAGDPVVPAPLPEPPGSRLGWGRKFGLGIVVLGIALVAGVAAWLVGEFTLDAGTVMIDGLLRLGALPPEDPQYLELLRLMKP